MGSNPIPGSKKTILNYLKMSKRYSRKAEIEQKKNFKKAIFFSILTLGISAIFFFFGLPSIIKFAAFLTDIRSTTTPVETSDTTPPPPPRLDSFPLYTNEKEIKIKGETEPGVNVKILVNGDEEVVLSDGEGEFNLSIKLKGGENKLSALAYDDSGNESKETKTYTIVFDNNPPELDVEKPENGAEFYGSSERQIVIEGTTEKDASVNINGRLVIVDSDESFTFATTLSEGENNFTIKAQDRAGNTTEKSLTVKFHP